MEEPDTIFAQSSGRGRAGIAVIRVSGAAAGMAVDALAGARPEPRKLVRRVLSAPDTGETLDQAMVVWFPGPDSYTGEDVAELHVHGGHAVLSGILEALNALDGLRPAVAGEFTRRALENGKLDLTRAEAVHDLIMAETEAQRRLSLAQAAGGLGKILQHWRQALIAILAQLEAYIDFPDEDIPDQTMLEVRQAIDKIVADMPGLLRSGQRGERIRGGFDLVILGAPNAGKSTLLNRLARDDVAIVSDIAGTTRDAIEVRVDLGGYLVNLIDTAGLHDGGGTIEAEGVRRALARAAGAGLVLRLVDAADPGPPIEESATAIQVWNKIDLAPQAELPQHAYPISALTGEGVDKLLAALEARVVTALEHESGPTLTRLRHRQALELAAERLNHAQLMLDQDIVLAAEDIRLGLREIGRVTGDVDVDEILDRIFGEFCIGK